MLTETIGEGFAFASWHACNCVSENDTHASCLALWRAGVLPHGEIKTGLTDDVPPPLTNVESRLNNLLRTWCETHHLPPRSADDLLEHAAISAEQRAWLSAFIVLWDISV